MVFSEYELKQMGIKIGAATVHTLIDCVGSCEEKLDSKTVSKKCRGIVVKTRTKGTGTGELKVSLHCPYDMYVAAYGLENEDLKEGVVSYGETSTHKTMSITELVEDEDGVIKFKAYPNCMIKEGIARKIENGGEEVAEVELTISIMPDDYGQGMYEAIKTGLDATVTSTWMTAFTPALVRATEA